MSRLTRITLVRHGETVAQSSIRFFGATDVPLSDVGRDQARASRRQVLIETCEAVFSSSLSRAWEAARIIAPNHPIRLESDFAEIDFGRWEGLTRQEIEALDPELYRDWQNGVVGFEFPEGETRAAFRARVEAGLSRLRATGVRSALVVAHRGVVRNLLELVAGYTLEGEVPELGGVIHAYRDIDGTWKTGRRGSDATCSLAPVGIPIQTA